MKRQTLARKILCIAAILCTAAWSANAVAVTNSGFETGDFTGWTHTGDSNGFDGVGMDSAFAHSGMHYAYLGSTPDNGSLSQSLSTMAGQSYSLSFWLANDVTVGLPPGNYFEVFWNGVSVFSLTNSAAFDYTQFGALNLMATGATSTLEFRYRNDNDFWRLDDVNVSGVPEAFSTIWLALPAFGALGLLHFSRARGRKSLAHI